MNNLKKFFFLDTGPLGKTLIVITVLLAIYSGFNLTQSPSSLELIYIQLSFTLVLTLIIAGVSRISNNLKAETLGGILIGQFLGAILIPIALAYITTDYVLAQAMHSSSPPLEIPFLVIFVTFSTYTALYFSIFWSFLFNKKPSNIFWLEILARGGGPMLSLEPFSVYRVGWFSLPWFGEVIFKKVLLESREKINFNHIEVGSKVKVVLKDGPLTKNSILSVTTANGVVIYQS